MSDIGVEVEVGVGVAVGVGVGVGVGVAVAVDPIAAARALHARFHVTSPGRICVERIAAALDAYVVYGDTGSADARVVWSGDVAYLCIAREHEGTPRARFSIAHELAHLLLHRGFDGLARIHGAPRTRGREYQVEIEANRFASELLLPRALLRPWTRLTNPSLEDVSHVANVFATSLTATMKKWTEVTDAPCAFVASRAGRVIEAKRSSAFRGVAVNGRALELGSAARELARAGENAGDAVVTRVHREAWGSAAMGREVIEDSVGIAGTGIVVSWVRHG